jgi:Protein of unknown function (DUF3618)
MAQDASEIREAIERTRDDIGETIQAIGEKADVKARLGQKLAEAEDTLNGSAAGAKAKLGDVAHRVGDGLPDAAGPVVSSAAEWAKSGVRAATEPGRRQRLVIGAGSMAFVIVLLARRARHSRGKQ